MSMNKTNFLRLTILGLSLFLTACVTAESNQSIQPLQVIQLTRSFNTPHIIQALNSTPALKPTQILAKAKGVRCDSTNFRKYIYKNILYMCDFEGADLSGIKLRSMHFFRVNFIGANLTGADLSWLHCTQCNFFGANLTRAKLKGATFIGSDFSLADLSEVDLFGAKLFSVELRRANLTKANLTEADLYAVTIERAKIEGAIFSGTVLVNVLMDKEQEEYIQSMLKKIF